MTQVSRLLQHNDDNSTSSEEDSNDFGKKHDSDSSGSEEKETHRRRKKKTRKEGSIKQTEDTNWRFKKRDPTHPDFKAIKPSNSLYEKVVSYRLYRLRRTTRDRTFGETGKANAFTKRMEIPLRRHHLNGEDSIRL